MGGAATFSSPQGGVLGETRIFSKANARPVFFCAIAVIGAVLYGYDGTYFTGILEMERFKLDYGQQNADGVWIISSSDQSLYASIIQAGEVVGALVAGPLGDFAGRRGGLGTAGLLLCLGVILQLIVAGSKPLLTVGRLVLGSGVGIISNATPLYLSEVAPTAIRGPIVGSWQLMLAIGQVIGAVIPQGSKDIDSAWSYRTPIICNLFFILVLLLALLILPESPRWLISKNRDEKALESLERINKGQDPSVRADVIQFEYDSFRQARQDELDLNGDGGWSALFKGDLRKFICVVGILISQQIGGVQFIFSYSTVFFASVGLTNSFLMSIIVTVIEVVGVICSFPLVQNYGRRPLLLWTSIPMFIALFVVAGIGTKGLPPTGQTLPYPGVITITEGRTIAAMICVYVFFFNLAWGPLAWVCASELGTGRNRSKIMSVGTTCFWITAWAVTFTLPYLFDNAGLGAQIGWIYGVGTLIAMAFVFFVIPETRGRSLEEISEMQEKRVAVRQWSTYETTQERMRYQRSADIAEGTDSVGSPASIDDLDKKKGTDNAPTRVNSVSDAEDQA